MARDPLELLPYLGGRLHEIDGAGRHGAARHALLLGGAILSEGDPPGRLDLLDPQRPVTGRPGQYDADALVTMLFGERTHEVVDRAVLSEFLGSRRELQVAVGEHEILPRGDDVDVIRLHRRVIGDLHHRHRRGPVQDLRQHAVIGGRQMLDDDEGHTHIGGERVEQRHDRFEAARRCADRDDRKGQGLLGCYVVLDGRVDGREDRIAPRLRLRRRFPFGEWRARFPALRWCLALAVRHRSACFPEFAAYQAQRRLRNRPAVFLSSPG